MINKIKTKLKSLLFEGEVLKLMSLAVLTKPIGLVSQILMAKYYGAGIHYDAYMLSFFLVNFLANTLGQVFSAIAIPYLATHKKKLSSSELSAFVNAIVLITSSPLVLMAVLLIFKGSFVVNLAAPNAPMETKVLAIRMLQWMAVPGILCILVECLKSILNANKAFRIPASMPIVNSLTMLLVLILGHNAFGIWALPIAFIISYSLQSVVIIIYAAYRGVIVAVRPYATKASLQQLWGLGWMVIVATVFQIINRFMDKYFASGLVEGSISSIAYAGTLKNFGTQMFQFSLVTVMFTRMSEFMAADDTVNFNSYLKSNIRRLSRIAIPVSLAVSLCSSEIIQVLLQRDAFMSDDTARTASALSMYMLGLPAFLLNLILARVFHTLKKLRDKMWLALQFLVTNVAGNFLLVGPLKVMGLAISSTVAINVHLALSAYMLARYKTGLDVRSMCKIVLVQYGIALLTWIIYHFSNAEQLLTNINSESASIEATITCISRSFIIFAIYGLLLLVRQKIKRNR